MCGIVTYFNKNGISSEELNENLNSLKAIKHRGPDGEGGVLINIYDGSFLVVKTDETPRDISFDVDPRNYKEFSAQLFIGHRRLSIIDTSVNGHQPMQFANKYLITFNGEVYNYIEIKKELSELGYRFKTGSDTEVILAAYDKWKERAVEKFNGMFSFVIYDIQNKKLLVANDRYGVKPLYYLNKDNKLIFFSEVKQIRSYSVNTSLNIPVFKEFLSSSYLDYDQQTVYKEVTRFKSSHFAEIELGNFTGQVKQTPYYSLKFLTKKISIPDAIDKFNFLFNSAVDLRMRSDVTVGCSLSGGLDSSSILARAVANLKLNNAKGNLNTFSIIFPGLSGDESIFVDLMVKQLNVTPHYINALEEFTLEDFEDHIYCQDMPVHSTSYYAEWSLAKKVRKENVTVLLNGQGGDEILAGYHHHFYRYCRELILSGKILKYLSLANSYAQIKEMSVNKLHQLVFNDLKLVVKFKTGLIKHGASLENKWNSADKLIEILKLDFTEYMLPTYLRSDDRDFMASHVETRHPFLDYRLVDFCNSLPDDLKIRDGWQKWLLRIALKELPEEIKFRKDKKGYTTPQELWIQKYKSEFENYLTYLPKDLAQMKSNDKFLKYSLGAWFKVNTFH